MKFVGLPQVRTWSGEKKFFKVREFILSQGQLKYNYNSVDLVPLKVE